jgi:hypothetical protein
MQSKAATVDAYLASLPTDRRQTLQAVRQIILKNLPKGVEEGMQYGMIGYYIPHDLYPPGYHCDPKQPLCYAGLASQKNHVSLYLSTVYGPGSDEAWFRKAWTATGNKLDMGKSCVRFRKLEDIPLDVVGEAIRRVRLEEFIKRYEKVLKNMRRKPAKTKAAGKKRTEGKKASRGAAKPARRATARKATTRRRATSRA